MAWRKNPPVHIYGLVDPGDMGVRYIGRSRDPMTRFHGHVSAGMLNYKAINKRLYGWIDDLAKAGSRPMLLLIEKVAMEQAPAAEQKWIDRQHDPEPHQACATSMAPGRRSRLQVGR